MFEGKGDESSLFLCVHIVLWIKGLIEKMKLFQKKIV